MRNKSLICVLILLIIAAFRVDCANAATIYASYPSFTIAVNADDVRPDDNKKRLYPYLEYGGITYFPMTWHDAGRIKYLPEWDGEKLNLKSRDDLDEYEFSEIRNAASQRAAVRIVTQAVYVDGERLELDDKWPAFSYRDIIYIPMTWLVTQQMKLGNEFISEGESFLHITTEGYVSPPKYYTGQDVYYEFSYKGEPLYVRLHYGPRVDGNTLSYSYDGEHYTMVGSTDYFFGTKSEASEGGSNSGNYSYTEDRDIFFEDGWIYVTASRFFFNEPSHRYKINIETEEMVLIE